MAVRSAWPGTLKIMKYAWAFACARIPGCGVMMIYPCVCPGSFKNFPLEPPGEYADLLIKSTGKPKVPGDIAAPGQPRYNVRL